MNSINQLFFDVLYSGVFLDTLYKVLFFLAFWGMCVYFTYFILSKVIKKSTKRDIQIKLSFLWALIFVQFLFVVYIFFLFRTNGVDFINLFKNEFYLAFLAQILVFLIGILVFISKYSSYLKVLSLKK